MLIISIKTIPDLMQLLAQKQVLDINKQTLVKYLKTGLKFYFISIIISLKLNNNFNDFYCIKIYYVVINVGKTSLIYQID